MNLVLEISISKCYNMAYFKYQWESQCHLWPFSAPVRKPNFTEWTVEEMHWQ